MYMHSLYFVKITTSEVSFGLSIEKTVLLLSQFINIGTSRKLLWFGIAGSACEISYGFILKRRFRTKLLALFR